MLKPQIKKQITKLHQKKYRYEFNEFLVEGVKGVEEALKDATVLVVVIEGNRRDEKDIQHIIKLAEKKRVPIEFCGRKDIGSIKATETFSGVMAIVEMPEYTEEDIINNSPIVYLDNIKDPGNLGTIIRTADWFGVENILLSEDSVDPYNEKCVRSTMGSISRVKIIRSSDAIKSLNKLRDEEYNMSVLAMEGENISKMNNSNKTVYMFGSESHGLRKEIEKIGEKYTIPGKGGAESLNLAVSVGIVLANI